MLEYNSDVYADQHCQFHESLKKTRLLIVCGYGFQDKGINRKIVEWLYADAQHKLIIIHPKPEDLVASARAAISNNWNTWKTGDKLHVIHRRIEDTDWSLIVHHLY